MNRAFLIRVCLVRVGDLVSLPHVAFSVQQVYKGGGRVSLVTDRGFPVDFDAAEVVSVIRRAGAKK